MGRPSILKILFAPTVDNCCNFSTLAPKSTNRWDVKDGYIRYFCSGQG
jgi:hypothetical protein